MPVLPAAHLLRSECLGRCWTLAEKLLRAKSRRSGDPCPIVRSRMGQHGVSLKAQKVPIARRFLGIRRSRRFWARVPRVGNLQEPERLDPFRRGSSLHAKVRCELPLKVCRETRTLPKLGPSEVGLFSKRGRRILTTSHPKPSLSASHTGAWVPDDLGRPAVSQRPPGPDSHRRGPCSAAPVEWPRHFPRGPNFTSHEPCSFTKRSTGSS